VNSHLLKSIQQNGGKKSQKKKNKTKGKGKRREGFGCGSLKRNYWQGMAGEEEGEPRDSRIRY